jgi:DNA gyrase subunit A
MATASGQSIRFHESDVRPMGRTARGVIGIRMAKSDSLVEMETLSGKSEIVSVTERGYGKRTPVEEYRLQGRGGSGIINIRASQRNGKVVACMAVDEDDQILLITANGKIIRFAVNGVSSMGRATQGVRLIHIDEGDKVASAIRTAEETPESESESSEEEPS